MAKLETHLGDITKLEVDVIVNAANSSLLGGGGGNNDEENLLARCSQNSLELAVKHEQKSIAFPSISTGIYNYPSVDAANIAVSVACNFLKEKSTLNNVIFCCFDSATFSVYENSLSEHDLGSKND